MSKRRSGTISNVSTLGSRETSRSSTAYNPLVCLGTVYNLPSRICGILKAAIIGSRTNDNSLAVTCFGKRQA